MSDRDRWGYIYRYAEQVQLDIDSSAHKAVSSPFQGHPGVADSFHMFSDTQVRIHQKGSRDQRHSS